MAAVLNFLLAVNILQITWACPEHTRRPSTNLTVGDKDRKSDEIKDMMTPVVTIASIKAKLKETGIFDQDNTTLTEREQKELKKLFDTVEIMTSSRARQPSNVQSVFSSLRMVERVVNKQMRDGQVSKSLAAKFHWDKLETGYGGPSPYLPNVVATSIPTLIRTRREQPTYRLDKEAGMRIFNMNT